MRMASSRLSAKQLAKNQSHKAEANLHLCMKSQAFDGLILFTPLYGGRIGDMTEKRPLVGSYRLGNAFVRFNQPFRNWGNRWPSSW